MRHVFMRLTPRFGPPALVVLILAGIVAAAAVFVRWSQPLPELELLVLGPDGQFHEDLTLPAEWADTATVTPDGVARFRLILGVRNVGYETSLPGRLILAVPARYRITGAAGQELPSATDPASPLVSYLIEPRLEPVEPGRLPSLLPAHETLWLEAVVPRYYCVELAESIPEFVVAPPAPAEAMSEVRLYYAFEGGDLERRHTGTLTVRVDPSFLAVTMPPQPPTFPMVVDAELARPDLGPLRHVATHAVRCGEPEAPLEMQSSVWEAEGGARLIVLEYGGAPRKYLYDLNGDGVIDRESWDPEGAGRFTATRRAQLPIPDFLLPPTPPARFDLARFAEIPPDSLALLDPFRRAMQEPGAMPELGAQVRDLDAAPPAPAPAAPRDGLPGRPDPDPAAEPTEPPPAQPPPPARPPAQPLGRPVGDG
jgi:hypothetical protein